MNSRSYDIGHERHPHFVTGRTKRSLKQSLTFGRETAASLAVIRTICDQTKLNIYRLLQAHNELSVADLSEILDISQSAVSHALADMKKFDLVDCCRCGKLMCYSLTENGKELRALEVFRELVA